VSTHADRTAKVHYLSIVPKRSSRSGAGTELRSWRSWLGKQAAIGGKPHIDRLIAQDQFTARLQKMSGADRILALEAWERIRAAAPEKPVPYTPASKHTRQKVRWTDDLRARFRFEVMRSTSDKDLCDRLGLDRELCWRSMQRERSRLGIKRAPKAGMRRSQPFPMKLAA